jgi:hypothetical protein
MDEEILLKKKTYADLPDDIVFARLELSASWSNPQFYNEALDIIERLEDLRSPTEKVNLMLNMTNAVKTAIIDLSKGTLELNDLRDEIKVSAFIILRGKVLKPAAEVELIKDYLGNRLSAEHRGISNFASAINYIISEII